METRPLALSLAAILLAGCSARGPGRTPLEPAADLPLEPASLSEEDATSPRDSAPSSPAPLPSPRALAPGDEIEIVVHGSPDLSLSFIVPEGGAVTVPPLGPTPIAGRTPFELEAALVEGFRDAGVLVDPKVAVLVKTYAPRRVYVLDGVRRPKEYDLPEGRPLRLTQVIALAGGFLETARREKVAIFRDGGEEGPSRLEFDANAILAGSAPDPVVLADDTVVVAVQDGIEERIFVAGRVKHPGAYAFRLEEGVTVLRAIVLAGGLDKFADSSNVVVVREGADGQRRRLRVDLSEVLGGDASKDLPLLPGDVVIVPESFF
jgi:polysaccharide export outer membrane protein